MKTLSSPKYGQCEETQECSEKVGFTRLAGGGEMHHTHARTELSLRGQEAQCVLKRAKYWLELVNCNHVQAHCSRAFVY